MREIELVCDLHRIPVGTPDQLAGFVRSLNENKYLAMDFWSLVQRMRFNINVSSEELQHRAPSEVTRNSPDRLTIIEQLLETVVESVAGARVQEIVSGEGEASESVTNLAILLTEKLAASSALSQPNPTAKSSQSQGHNIEIEKLTSQLDHRGHALLRPYGEYQRSVVKSELPSIGKLVTAPSSSTTTRTTSAKKHNNESGLHAQAQKKESEPIGKPRLALWFLAVPTVAGVCLFTAMQLGMHTGGSSFNLTANSAIVVPQTPALDGEPRHSSLAHQIKNANSDTVILKPAMGGIVSVSHAVMQARLISSQSPIYPKTSAPAGVEGRVVLKIVVLKNGTVGQVRMLAGNPALSSAALQAVAQWKYKPYLLNGQPADISTLAVLDLPRQ